MARIPPSITTIEFKIEKGVATADGSHSLLDLESVFWMYNKNPVYNHIVL